MEIKIFQLQLLIRKRKTILCKIEFICSLLRNVSFNKICRFVARRILKKRRRLIKNSVIFLKEVACQRKLEMIFEKLARTLFGCPEASISGYARTSLQNFSFPFSFPWMCKYCQRGHLISFELHVSFLRILRCLATGKLDYVNIFSELRLP